MKSQAVKKWIDARKKEEAKAIERLDEAAATIEAMELPGVKVSVVQRIFEIPRVFISRDLTDEETINEVAVPILRRLAKAGYKIKDTYSDYAQIGRREWKLEGFVIFAVFVLEDGKACRRVKVGQEMMDKYEIVCD